MFCFLHFALISLFSFCCSANTFESYDEDWVVTKTFYGDLRGKRLKTPAGTPYFSFRGVPYATAAQNDLRFKLTFPPKHWHLFKDANNDTKACIQNPMHPIKLKDVEHENDAESEDCLFMNIYTPAAEPPRNGWPVLYVVHDGWFNYGSLNDFDWDTFVDKFVRKDIVVILIQYRLGIFGFLSTGDKQGMGNWGLWDIIQGLKYVKDTGRKYGMNPQNVTLFGYGSGAAAVSLLNYMHEAEALFNQTIAHSGSAYSFWACSDERATVISEGISDELECGEFDTKPNKEKALECLRKKKLKDLRRGQLQIEKILDKLDELVPELLFVAPRFDEILIPNSLDVLAEQRDVKPMLIGVSQGDMNRYMVRGKHFDVGRGFERMLVKEPGKFSAQEFAKKLAATISSDLWPRAATTAAKLAEDIYVGNALDRDSSMSLLKAYSQVISDVWVNTGAYQEAAVQSKRGAPVWFYDIDFSDAFQLPKDFALSTDLMRLLGLKRDPKNAALVPFDQSLSDALVQLYVNFIKTGNPNPVPFAEVPIWSKFTPDAPQNLRIDPSGNSGQKMELKPDFLPERMAFWIKTLPELEVQLGGSDPRAARGNRTLSEEELLTQRVELPPGAVAKDTGELVAKKSQAKLTADFDENVSLGEESDNLIVLEDSEIKRDEL